VAAALTALSAMLVLTSLAGASLSPTTAFFELLPGTGATETGKQVTLAAQPAAADVEIAIDTTGSMSASIAQAKADALAIVSGVQGVVPNTQFAVVQFKDNFDTPEYRVEQAMTATAANVQAAINGLSAGGGGDSPEAYNLVFHNSYTPSTGGDIGWRSGTRKFVIVLGDAAPHGAGSAGVPGCTDTSADPHGLNTATELAGMKTAQRTLFMILQTSTAQTTLACYQGLAAGAYTGGQGVNNGTDLAAQIVALIQAAGGTVGDVHLEVASASPSPADASWITLPAALGPVAAPGTYTFGSIGINVPLGTPSGTYTFDLVALADGSDAGHQTITVQVQPEGSGAFVIGNGNAAIGTSVTFWGAQWAKLNSLSGGSAPASFKGFAINPPSVTCGDTWTTDPGNSAPPPLGPLPPTINVIVSSKITKSGAVISGNVVKIVTVATNPGYENNPGHAGTGKVVATICSS